MYPLYDFYQKMSNNFTILKFQVRQRKLMDYYGDNTEYYEDELEDENLTTNLEDDEVIL